MLLFQTAQCIGCGCTDTRACFDHQQGQPCHWVRLDRDAALGVCSTCESLAPSWDAGDREMRTSATEDIRQATCCQPADDPPHSQSNIDPALRVRMVAAIWGTCYLTERTTSGGFDTTWRRHEDGSIQLVGASENGAGAFSFQVEGLLIRHLIELGRIPNFLDLTHAAGSDATFVIRRAAYRVDLATPAQWAQLKQDLRSKFWKGGRGFYAHDLKFSDMAIDWLAAGKPCEAGACSKLP